MSAKCHELRGWLCMLVLSTAMCWGSGVARATNVLSFDVMEFGSGNGPTATTLADFNGDGIQDLAVANADGDNVHIYLGTGTGNGFATGPSRVLSGTSAMPLKSPQGIVAADLDGQNGPDIAVTNYNGASVVVFLNQGGGTFGSPARKITVSSNPLGIAASRLRGPTQPVQLIVAAKSTSAAGELTVLNNDGAANFTAVTFNVGERPKQVAVADLGTAAGNRQLDQKLDLVVTLQGADDAVAVLYRTNTAAGDPITTSSFSAPNKFPANAGPTGIAIADFNQDNCLDVAVANHQGTATNKVPLLMGVCGASTKCGLSGGNLSAPMEIAQFGSSDNTFGVIAGDLNGDSKPDLIATNGGSAGQAVLLRNDFDAAQCAPSSTTFASAACATDSGSKGLVAGDFNGDAHIDLAVANQTADDVSILLLDGSASQCPSSQITLGTSAPKHAVAMAACDVTNAVGTGGPDGIPDLLVLHSGTSQQVLIYSGDGGGGFARTVTVASSAFVGTGQWGTSGSAIACGDLDADLNHRPDFIFTNNASSENNAVECFNGGNGLFTCVDPGFSGLNEPSAIAVGDLAGYGSLSPVITNKGNNTVWVAGAVIAVEAEPTGVVLGKFQTGTPNDIAVSPNGSGVNNADLIWNLSPGPMQFGPYFPYGLGNKPNSSILNIAYAATSGVLRNPPPSNVYDDLVAVNEGQDCVTVLLSNGSRLFHSPVSYLAGSQPNSAVIDDFDLDGNRDVAVADYWRDEVAVLKGSSTGALTACAAGTTSCEFSGGNGPISIQKGNFNADSKPDIAVLNRITGNITILINTSYTTGC